jgi:cytochrome b6-f complex iron-sulfur subunit
LTGTHDDRAGGAEHEFTRRDLVDRLLAGGACLWAAGVLVPAGADLWPARAGGPGEEYAKAGSPADLPVWGSRMIQHEGKPIIVLRVSETEFRAFSAICTHLGCVVQWDAASRQIHCPCHAGFFGPDGGVVSGPPPRPLAAHRAVVAGDEIRVYA